ncbi:hypothetical protein VSDG_01079 [Cytospora chrysosperma]|uniref:Uncharacterized protein n=1 Tax=Cytospora chrysosperma TaxID=252740 RepID=A0A423WLY1_CYTCH|nr:hypothetical protein VSDG_01079 [Valsa sordida]
MASNITSISTSETAAPVSSSDTASATSTAPGSTPTNVYGNGDTDAFVNNQSGLDHILALNDFVHVNNSNLDRGTNDNRVVTRTIVNTPSVNTADSASATSSSGLVSSGQSDNTSSKGISSAGTIAVAVVVPIAAVAILVALGIWLWRKRKARKEAEEERRKEVEDYQYNPNADPTIAGSGGPGSYEMKEDSSSGYRGWGSTTLAGSTGRKASTTMSGGAPGGAYSDTPYEQAYSDGASPTRAAHSGEPLMDATTHTPEGEILGAMGPSSANNRGGNVRRGPSNASSSYSAGAPSDGSGEIGMAYGGDQYYTQFDPYPENGGYNNSPPGGQPVIRDNPARRNTRIENPSHFPQQSAGISQNF